ncbi:MAG TPA: hypothetical protein VM325_03300 [Alphaproteobacteria bacterium]|nr:hypothetical protein [Alphaproteobacteria bacterium]
MGTLEDLVGLSGAQLARIVEDMRDAGSVGRFVQNKKGEWDKTQGVPPTGTPYVELMANGEVLRWNNSIDGDQTYQRMLGPMKKR